MLLKTFSKLKCSPCYIKTTILPPSSVFGLKRVSEWKKQQELKKKILDTNEAESLRSKINERSFGFSLYSGLAEF
jgi:hypothetical protein